MQKIITHLNFAKGFRGGERQTQLLIEKLSTYDYKQKLLVRKNSELISRCNHIKNLEIIEITKPYVYHMKHLKGSSILHAHETKALQFAYIAHLFKSLPYIVTRRVDNPIKINFLNAAMYKNAKICIALSSAIKEGILQVSQDANIKIIPDAFSNKIVDKVKSLNIKQRFSGKFLIGHVGALDDKHKGQSIIIELAKKVINSHPNIQFIFVGGGHDEDLLKEMAKDLNNITFEGFVNNVNDYIASFDIFLFPSRNEGLGSTLLDVMNIGVPIVASNVGGIPDIIQNDKNGILFDISNVNKLKNIILELHNDNQKQEYLVLNAKKTVEKYSVENMTKSYIKLYEDK